MGDKVIFEILVDRLNEKWAWAFEHILIVLHKILEEKPNFFNKKVFYYRFNYIKYSKSIYMGKCKIFIFWIKYVISINQIKWQQSWYFHKRLVRSKTITTS